VRDSVEYILRGQGRWEESVQVYHQHLTHKEILVRMPRSLE
jgi:hypothetical protein